MAEHRCCRQCHPGCFPAEALAAAPSGPGHVAVRFDKRAGRHLWVEHEGVRVPAGSMVTEALAGTDGWYLTTEATSQNGGPRQRIPCPCGRAGAYVEYVVRGAVALRALVPAPPASEK